MCYHGTGCNAPIPPNTQHCRWGAGGDHDGGRARGSGGKSRSLGTRDRRRPVTPTPCLEILGRSSARSAFGVKKAASRDPLSPHKDTRSNGPQCPPPRPSRFCCHRAHPARGNMRERGQVPSAGTPRVKLGRRERQLAQLNPGTKDVRRRDGNRAQRNVSDGRARKRAARALDRVGNNSRQFPEECSRSRGRAAAMFMHKPILPLCKTQMSLISNSRGCVITPFTAIPRPQAPKPGRSGESPLCPEATDGTKWPQQSRVPRSQGQNRLS